MEYKLKYSVSPQFNIKTFQEEPKREYPKKEKAVVKGKAKKKTKKEKKILGKPKVKLVHGISSVKAIKQIAQSTDSKLVTEGRTGYFNEEMMKEREKIDKWFGGYSL